MIATIIVLANLASIGVTFLYQLLGRLFSNPDLGDLSHNRLVNVLTCFAFLVLATFIAYHGITTTEKIQFFLVFFQLGVLALFVIMAFTEAGGPHDQNGIPFSWDWSDPFTGLTVSALVAGLRHRSFRSGAGTPRSP